MKTMAYGRAAALLFAAAFAGTAFGATEYFVNANGGQDGAGRGLTEATAFLSVQAAVDAASEGDTITLLPGDYTEGLTEDAKYGRSRVVIDKKLTLRSKNGRASRDTTRIVGAWDTTESSSYPYGMGPKRIRCVCVLKAGAGSTFEGLTFYRGAASHDGDNDHGGGGLFVCDNKGVTAIDCAFRECQARNGGGMCSMGSTPNIAVRCLFKRNRLYKFASAFRGGSCYNCVFDDNDYTRKADGTIFVDNAAYGAGATDYSDAMINCTFIGSVNRGVGSSTHSGGIHNCTVVYCGGDAIGSGASVYSHCVTHDSKRTDNGCVYVDVLTSCEVYSPYDEDYRLIKGARSLTTGAMENLEKIPAAYRDTDYYGNPRTTGGVVYCGAVQEALAETTSGFSITVDPPNGYYEKDGKRMALNCRTIIQRPGLRNTFNVKYIPASGKALLRYCAGDRYFWPKKDDSVWAANMTWGGVHGLKTDTTATILYVDAASTAETPDGTAEKPFATIQAAIDKVVAAKADAVVYVRKGDYATGETEMLGLKSRVTIPAGYVKRLRIVAVDGTDETFITGAEDPDSTETWKLGPNAVRCVAAACTNASVAIQGFTLRNGFSDASGDNSQSRGGALCARDAAGNPIYEVTLVDCAVTNCAARYGSASYGGALFRCRVTGCLARDGLVRSSQAYSCLMTGSVRYNTDSRVVGYYASVYNCTVAENDPVGISTVALAVRNCVFGWNGLAGNNGCDLENAIGSGKIAYTLYQKANATMDASNVREFPVLFLGTSAGDYTLLDTSKGNALASINGQRYPLMDVNGESFTLSTNGF